MSLADGRSIRLSELCMDKSVAFQLCGWCSLCDPVAAAAHLGSLVDGQLPGAACCQPAP